MSKARVYAKLVALSLCVISITLAIAVLHTKIKQPIDRQKNDISEQEIRNMIKKLPNYQGDSLVIDEDGRIKSMDGLIQSVLIQMYIVPENLEAVRNEANAKQVPEPYQIYKAGIMFYLAEHGSKLKIKDTTKVKLKSNSD